MRTNGIGRPALVLTVIFLMSVQAIALFPAATSVGAAPSSRIIVVSNQTSIPLAMGTPSTGLNPFTGHLVNRMGVHVTGQVVDGNYTPLWQAGASSNHGIGDVMVYWSFGPETDRAHRVTTDGTGRFSLFITPEVEAPASADIRFWFDGKSDTVYGIPIYPAAEVVYAVAISESADLTVEPAQSRAMAGDTVLVQGSMKGPDGTAAAGEGLLATIDGRPAVANPHSGWFVDNVVLGPLAADFEEDFDGFTAGGKGTWSSGIPSAGPLSGSASIRCAGASMAGSYAYDTDGWLEGPPVDLSTVDNAALLFDSWSDVANGDEIAVELSSDGGVTWPVHVAVTPGTTWTAFQVPIGVYKGTAYGTVDLTHSKDLRFRFRLAGHNMPITTDAEGTFEFLYTIPKDRAAGTAVITVEHPASKRFTSTAATASLNIARRTVIELSGPGIVYRGAPAEARAGLTDTDGTVLITSFPGQQVPKPSVRFWLRQGSDERYLGERAVDKDGLAAIGIDSDRSSPLGPAQVRCAFAGNEFYGPAETIVDATFKAHTQVVITKPTTALIANELDVEGTVLVVPLESSGNAEQDPIMKTDVQIFLDGSLIGTATTDFSGKFSYSQDVSGIYLGSAVITVIFPGDRVYEPSEATVDFSILPDTSIAVGHPTVYKGNTATITGYLNSAQGPVQGVVEAFIDGRYYTSVASTVYGDFTFSYEVPFDAAPGQHPMTLTYRGSKTHRPTTTAGSIDVRVRTIILVPKEPVNVHRGGTATIRGSLVEDWGGKAGDPVEGAYINFRLDDGTFIPPVTTNPNGNFTLVYSPLATAAVGDVTINASSYGVHTDMSYADIGFRVASTTAMTLDLMGSEQVAFGSPVLITLALRDDRGDPVSRRIVTVTSITPGDENVVFKGSTEYDGTISMTLVMNETGTRTLVAKFDGDQYYGASQANQTVYVKAQATGVPIQRQPTIVLGSGLGLILLLAVALTENGKYFLFKLILVPMYSKLKKEDVLDHFVRGQIYGLIRVNPGAHYNMIKQRLDLTNGVLSYHLSTLEREGYIISEMDGIYKRFFPNHVKFEVDYPIFLSKIQERIVDFIKSKPGITQKEVAKELELSTSTVNDNIQVLKQANIVDLKRDGKRTRCYIVENDPAPTA